MLLILVSNTDILAIMVFLMEMQQLDWIIHRFIILCFQNCWNVVDKRKLQDNWSAGMAWSGKDRDLLDIYIRTDNSSRILIEYTSQVNKTYCPGGCLKPSSSYQEELFAIGLYIGSICKFCRDVIFISYFCLIQCVATNWVTSLVNHKIGLKICF